MSQNQRTPRYENKALRDLCRGQPCFLKFPGVCRNNVETVVPVHSNLLRHGHGCGIKAHDVFVVPGCGECHYELDHGHQFSRDMQYGYTTLAIEAWTLYLWRHGLVQVARKPAPAERARKSKRTARPEKVIPRIVV